MADRDPSLHILQHALGLDDYGRDQKGRVPSDIEEPYRNRFVTSDGTTDWPLCVEHFEAGRMSKHGPSPLFGGGDSYCFCVTELGLAFVREHSPKPIAVGDTVICTWTTARGAVKKARGQVLAISRDRSKVKINYLHVGGSRGEISMESREGWRPMSGARKVQRKAQEQTPSEMIGVVVRAMAGKGSP